MDAGRRVLTVRRGRSDPAHGRQPACGGGAEVGPERLDVTRLMVVLHVPEHGERVPDPRRPGVLPDRGAGLGRIVAAVRLGAVLHVVPPADVVGVQQPGDVRPGQVDGRLAGGQLLLDGLAELVVLVRPDDVVDAAVRRAVAAPGGPGRDHVEVVGQRPRLDRLEHVVVQDEVPGVGPVVRELGPGVIAHHVRRGSHHAGRIVRHPARLVRRIPLPDEAVHRAATDVGDRVGLAVRAAAVHVGPVAIRAGAPARRIRHADRRHPVAHRDAVRPGIGPEVGVERPVLLHHDDHVLDLVDARRHHVGTGRPARDPPG